MFIAITFTNKLHYLFCNDSGHARRTLLSSFDEADNESIKIANESSENVNSNKNNFSSTPLNKFSMSLPNIESTAIVAYKPLGCTPSFKQAAATSTSLTKQSRSSPTMSPVVPDTLSIIQEHIPKKQISSLPHVDQSSYCLDNDGNKILYKLENETLEQATERIFQKGMIFPSRTELYKIAKSFSLLWGFVVLSDGNAIYCNRASKTNNKRLKSGTDYAQ